MPRNVSQQIRGKIELLAAAPFVANNNVKKLLAARRFACGWAIGE
jgi:hypothetical protein